LRQSCKFSTLSTGFSTTAKKLLLKIFVFGLHNQIATSKKYRGKNGTKINIYVMTVFKPQDKI